MYLRVKQTAFSQVAVMTFAHIHTLSLEWHLKKKMGQVTPFEDRRFSPSDGTPSLCR